MSRAALPNQTLLGQWLTQRPDDFAAPAAQAMVADLIKHASAVQVVAREHRQHRARWGMVSEAARTVALRRQLAAMAARVGMRNGMEQAAAIDWVISLAQGSRDAFKRETAAALGNGDRLYVWQWKELVTLGLRDDFLSRRLLARWLELEDPWVTDERWVYPLHLVDVDQLPSNAQYGGNDESA